MGTSYRLSIAFTGAALTAGAFAVPVSMADVALSLSTGYTLTADSFSCPIDEQAATLSYSGTNVTTGTNRLTSATLFADVSAATALIGGSTGGNIASAARSSVATPAADYVWGVWGPTYANVEASVSWAWANPGGDWFDQTGTSQATGSPHFTFSANSVSTGSATYSGITATAGAQAAWARGKWNAYIVKCTGGARSIAALHHPTLSAPSMSVIYTDATTDTLACLACVRLVNGTAYSQVGAQEAAISSSVALEFQMPTKAVASATITLAISSHSATAATVSGYVASPPVNTQSVVTGLASSYENDIGITADPSVLFAQQFTTTTLSDYVIASPTSVNVFSTTAWNPVVVGAGATDDDTRLPVATGGVAIAGTNKWFHKQNSTNLSVVASTYTGDGFEAPPSGHGALRIVTPGSAAADGAAVGSSGSLGSDLWALFGKADCGNVESFTVRFYYRYHVAGDRTIAGTKMYRQSSGGSASYAIPTGKFGPGGQCWTYFGGNNNTGGGTLGWSNRMGYVDAPADLPVQPRKVFAHVQDMIPGTNFFAGKDGGLGAALFPDTWYCIEVETILNTYDPTTGAASADGVMNIKIDGKLDATYTGWKFREGVLPAQDPTNLAAFRKIGAMGICLNDYNGGVLPPDRDLVNFYTNIVVTNGTEIGPVSVPININGSAWTPNRDGSGDVLTTDFPQLPANTWVTVAGSLNKLTDIQPATSYPNSSGSNGWPKIITAWGGAAWDATTYRMLITGGGHGDASSAENGIYAVNCVKMQVETVVTRSDYANRATVSSGTTLIQGDGWPAGQNYPTLDGKWGSQHTYYGLVHIPTATMTTLGLGSPVKGGLFMPGHARAVVNLDSGAYSKVWWKTSAPDDSYQTWVRYGTKLIWPRNSFSFARWDMTQTETTDWATSGQDPAPGTPSFGKDLTAASSGSNFVYNSRTFCDLAERNEMISFAASHQRVRYGAAEAAAATDWTSYQDTLTLTGTDAADLNTSGNYTDSGTNLLNGAGASYLHSSGEVFVFPNTSGNQVYRITGLASGTTGTVSKLGAGSALLTTSTLGTFGRARVFEYAGCKLAVRVSDTANPIEVMRIV